MLRIVSLGGASSDRAPSFDMPLADFSSDGRPLALEAACAKFADDASRRCAICPVIAILDS